MPFLSETEVDTETIAAHLRTNRAVGVPYSDDQIANAVADLKAQADPDNAGVDAFTKRYPKAACPQLRRQAGRARPKWTRWSPTCRCSARWSTSSFTTKKQIFAEKTFAER